MLRFDDIFIDCTRLGRKISKEKYLQKGKHIIIDQGQNDIAGYSNEEDGIFSDVPVIIFGDHTRIFKLIKNPFFLGADGTKILKAKISNMSYDYLYYYLKYKKIPNTGYNRHFKWLKELIFEIKDSKEQEKISIILDKVSKILEMKKQQLSELDSLIKFQFLKIFGDPILNTLNFPTKKVIEVIKLQRGFDLPINQRNRKGSISVFGANGVLGFHDEAKKNFGIITGRSGTLGEVYISEKPFWPLNTTLFSIDTYENNIIYLKYLLIFYDLKRFSSGTGVPTLNRNILHDKEIISVPIELQNKFADFVKQVDKSKVILEKALKSLSFRLNYYYML